MHTCTFALNVKAGVLVMPLLSALTVASVTLTAAEVPSGKVFRATPGQQLLETPPVGLLHTIGGSASTLEFNDMAEGHKQPSAQAAESKPATNPVRPEGVVRIHSSVPMDPVAAQMPHNATTQTVVITNYVQTAKVSHVRFGVLACLCIVANLVWQIAPYSQVKHWQSQGCTGEADATLYIATAFGGWQWCVYGALVFWLTKHSEFMILVLACLPVFLLGVYYVVTFLQYCRDPSAFGNLARCMAVAGFMVATQTTAIVASPARSLFLVRASCGLFSIAGAVNWALSLMPAAKFQKDGKAMTSSPAMTSFLCSAAWFVCGAQLLDPPVLASSGIVMMASILAVLRTWHSARLGDSNSLSKVPAEEVKKTNATSSPSDGEVVPVARAAQLLASKRMALLHAKGFHQQAMSNGGPGGTC